MPGMRQRLLPVAHPGRPQDSPHGGVAAQVPRLPAQFQSAFEPKDPSADAHRHQTLSLPGLWQSVPTKLRSASAFAHSQSGRHCWSLGDRVIRFQRHTIGSSRTSTCFRIIIVDRQCRRWATAVARFEQQLSVARFWSHINRRRRRWRRVISSA